MKKKRFLVFMLIFTMLLGGTIQASAAIPNISTNVYIKTYPLSTKNNTYVYTNEFLNVKGTASPYKEYNAVIYATDEIYVYSLNDSYAYISYLTSSGRRYGYIKTSTITNNNFSQDAKKSSANITTYKRAGGEKYGSISKGDSVWVVATSGNYTQVVYPVGNIYKMAFIATANYNRYVNTGCVPQGYLDSVVSNADSQITINGWAFDKDNVNANLQIHIYVGGPAGSGASGYAITANKYRPDVNNVFSGVGNYHGYSETLIVDKTGSQDIYVYAINEGAASENPLIGKATVTIKGKNSSNMQTTMTNALYQINTTSSKITCGFDGYTTTSGRHEGIDFSYGYGKKVYSLTDGVITNVVYGKNGSSGLSTIAIYNVDTNKTVIYLHTAPLSSLKVGQTITRGTQIATEAWRGCSNSSGTHNHVEVRDGKRTLAAKSVNHYILDNSNPTSFWNSLGYQVK